MVGSQSPLMRDNCAEGGQTITVPRAGKPRVNGWISNIRTCGISELCLGGKEEKERVDGEEEEEEEEEEQEEGKK